MTRVEALNEQRTLFPNKTLPEICMAMRMALNGSADPWTISGIKVTKTLLEHRLKVWQHTRHSASWETIIDRAVEMMVEATIGFADAWLKENS